jgi:hypothetical protein
MPRGAQIFHLTVGKSRRNQIVYLSRFRPFGVEIVDLIFRQQR